MIGGQGVYMSYITLLENYRCVQLYVYKHSKLSIRGRGGMGPRFPTSGSATGFVRTPRTPLAYEPALSQGSSRMEIAMIAINSLYEQIEAATTDKLQAQLEQQLTEQLTELKQAQEAVRKVIQLRMEEIKDIQVASAAKKSLQTVAAPELSTFEIESMAMDILTEPKSNDT